MDWFTQNKKGDKATVELSEKYVLWNFGELNLKIKFQQMPHVTGQFGMKGMGRNDNKLYSTITVYSALLSWIYQSFQKYESVCVYKWLYWHHFK